MLFKNFIATLKSYSDTQEPPLAPVARCASVYQVKPVTETVSREGKSEAAGAEISFYPSVN